MGAAGAAAGGAKNQVHAALMRNLKSRQPMRDLFGEEETVASCLREIDFLAGEIIV